MGFVYYKKIIKMYKVFNNNKGNNNVNYITVSIIGDKNGGLGIGKSCNLDQSVSSCKALSRAKKNFFKIYLKNDTLPHPIIGKSCNCVVKLYPLNNIYNFSSGSEIRSMLEIMGIKKVTSKIISKGSFYNRMSAAFNAFKSLNSEFSIIKKRNSKCF